MTKWSYLPRPFYRRHRKLKYIGIYWILFAPMMKKSIAKRFDKGLADKAIRQGKAEYKGLLARADDLGPGNLMALNAYFAYVFAAAWLGSGRRLTPDDLALVMTDVLESTLLRTFFGMTDLNRKPKEIPHNTGSRLTGDFQPSATCKLLDLLPVGLRNLQAAAD